MFIVASWFELSGISEDPETKSVLAPKEYYRSHQRKVVDSCTPQSVLNKHFIQQMHCVLKIHLTQVES